MATTNVESQRFIVPHSASDWPASPTTRQRHYCRALDDSRSLAEVALRAGHDPAVAAPYYTGRVDESDRALAAAIETLLDLPTE
jgi:hypothetical protein